MASLQHHNRFHNSLQTVPKLNLFGNTPMINRVAEKSPVERSDLYISKFLRFLSITINVGQRLHSSFTFWHIVYLSWHPCFRITTQLDTLLALMLHVFHSLSRPWCTIGVQLKSVELGAPCFVWIRGGDKVSRHAPPRPKWSPPSSLETALSECPSITLGGGT